MMNLKVLQQQFIQQLTDARLPDDFLEQLKPCGHLFPQQQLGIYQNNVRGALQKTLAQVYPVCQRILGENNFKQLASYYIKDHPSQQFDLNSYGEHFSSFMKEQCQQKSELAEFLYLSDLAQLEWLRQQVYYAAEATAFDFEAFAQFTEDQQAKTPFNCIPCLQFIHSDFPVLSIWQMSQQSDEIQASISSKQEICCVYRRQYQIKMSLIDSHTYNFLVLVNGGATLEEISQAGFAKVLAELISRGWIEIFKEKHV